MINCNTLRVDCVHDPKSSDYLGFIFDIPITETSRMVDFIKYACAINEVPLIDIYICNVVSVDQKNVATKRKITAEITKKADYLRSVAKNGHIR